MVAKRVVRLLDSRCDDTKSTQTILYDNVHVIPNLVKHKQAPSLQVKLKFAIFGRDHRNYGMLLEKYAKKDDPHRLSDCYFRPNYPEIIKSLLRINCRKITRRSSLESVVC